MLAISLDYLIESEFFDTNRVQLTLTESDSY